MVKFFTAGLIIGILSIFLFHSSPQSLASIPFPSPTSIPKKLTKPAKIMSPSPTLTPSPTKQPIPSAIPEPTNIPFSVNDYILNEINIFRREKGLGDVQKDQYTCDFAQIRAGEITTNFSHDGSSPQYPSFSETTENIAMTADYKEVINLWKNSPYHADNMSKDTPFACIGSSGNYYVYVSYRP